MKVTALGAAALCLMTVTALGADLGLPAPVVPLAFTWTGCYAGVQAGGGFGQKDLNDSAGIVSPIAGFTSALIAQAGVFLRRTLAALEMPTTSSAPAC